VKNGFGGGMFRFSPEGDVDVEEVATAGNGGGEDEEEETPNGDGEAGEYGGREDEDSSCWCLDRLLFLRGLHISAGSRGGVSNLEEVGDMFSASFRFSFVTSSITSFSS